LAFSHTGSKFIGNLGLLEYKNMKNAKIFILEVFYYFR